MKSGKFKVKKVVAEAPFCIAEMMYEKVKLEPNLLSHQHIIVTEEELLDIIEVHSALINQGILKED